jgi:hypothetical protein
MVRVWDACSGEQLGAPLTGDTGEVKAVALGRVGDREVIVSGSAGGKVRVGTPAAASSWARSLTESQRRHRATSMRWPRCPEAC